MEKIHTKRVGYGLLAIASILLSVYFSYRAAIMYYTFFETRIAWYFAGAFAAIVFVAIAIASFVSGTQWKNDRINWIILLVCAAHDIAGVFFTVFGENQKHQFAWTDIIAFVGMSAISILPFIFGNRMAQLSTQLSAEREMQHQDRIDNFEHRIEIRGVQAYEKLAKKKDIAMQFAPEHIRRLFSHITQEQIEAPRQPRIHIVEQKTQETSLPPFPLADKNLLPNLHRGKQQETKTHQRK